MADALFSEHKNYPYWIAHSRQHSILDVLEFCGNEQYIEEACLALPEFDYLHLRFGAEREPVQSAFVKNWLKFPARYRNAILRNGNLPTTFFERIVRDIDWKVFVENQGVDFDFFLRNVKSLSIYFCASSDVRKDIFDYFGKDELMHKLNIVQKLRSPHFTREDLWHLGPLCQTKEEKTTYVDRIILDKWKRDAPKWMNGTDYMFWYNFYNLRPGLCARMCDNRQFLQSNFTIFNWADICLNPAADTSYLQLRSSDINPDNLLKSARSEPLVNHFKRLYDDVALADWRLISKVPDVALTEAPHDKLTAPNAPRTRAVADAPSERELHYFGNKAIYNPVAKPAKLAEEKSAAAKADDAIVL